MQETQAERVRYLRQPEGSPHSDSLHALIETVDRLCLCPRYRRCYYCAGATSDCLIRIAVPRDTDGVIDVRRQPSSRYAEHFAAGLLYHQLNIVIPFMEYRYLRSEEIYNSLVLMHDRYGSFNRRRWIFCVDCIFPGLFTSKCDIPEFYL